MINWIPTNELRYVARDVKSRRAQYEGDTDIPYITKTILQQKWKKEYDLFLPESMSTEWRDVLVVEEE